MKIWNRYNGLVKSNCANPAAEIKDLACRRNKLFAGITIYLHPFCLIALLPSRYLIINLFVITFWRWKNRPQSTPVNKIF